MLRCGPELQEIHFRPPYESVLHRPELAGARSYLHVGCGSGLTVQIFAQTIATVAGIDTALGFIEIARERLPNADFRVGEMEILPFSDGTYDIVTGFNARFSTQHRHAMHSAKHVG